jgi:tol-pal system protein YbgF
MKRIALALALLVGGSQGCFAGLFSDDEAHRKIDELQQQNTQFKQQVQALDARLVTVEGATRSQGVLELLSQLDALKAELAKLRGQIEVHAHEIEVTQKRQRDLYADLDSRLRKLERGGAPANGSPAAGQVPLPAGEAGAGKPQAAADPAEETRAYEAALNQFKVGNYQGAIASFQGFVAAYPSSQLAPSAQYWIGNSYFNLRDYKNAMAAQQKLIGQYPASPKVPDAMLNIASCHQGLGDTAAAKAMLENLVAKFPLSNAADLAKKRLANLK